MPDIDKLIANIKPSNTSSEQSSTVSTETNIDQLIKNIGTSGKPVGYTSDISGTGPINPDVIITEENTLRDADILNSDIINAVNSFWNGVDQTQISNYQGKLDVHQKVLDENVDKKRALDKAFAEKTIDPTLYQEQINALEEENQKAISEIDSYQTDIAENKIEMQDQAVSKLYKLKEATVQAKGGDAGLWESIKYTLPSTVGSSASLMGQQLAATFGTNLAKRLIGAAASGAIGGPVGEAITVGGTLLTTVALLANSRVQETYAEVGGQLEQNQTALLDKWMQENPNQEPDEEVLRQIRMQARKGMDEFKMEQMALIIPDAVEALIMPGSKVLGAFKTGRTFEKTIKGLTDYNRATRTAATLGKVYGGYIGEKFEEGLQYAAGKRQEDAALELGNYENKGFIKNLLSDSGDVLSSISYGPGGTLRGSGRYSEDKEFQFSEMSGGLLSILPGSITGTHSIIKDLNTYRKTNKELQDSGIANPDDKWFKLKDDIYLKHFEKDTMPYLLEGIRTLGNTKNEQGIPLLSTEEVQTETKNVASAYDKYLEVSKHLEDITPEGKFRLGYSEEQKQKLNLLKSNLFHTVMSITRHSEELEKLNNLSNSVYNINNLIDHQKNIVDKIKNLTPSSALNSIYRLSERLKRAETKLKSLESYKQNFLKENNLSEEDLPKVVGIEESNKNKKRLIEELNLAELQENYDELLKIKDNETLDKWYAKTNEKISNNLKTVQKITETKEKEAAAQKEEELKNQEKQQATLKNKETLVNEVRTAKSTQELDSLFNLNEDLFDDDLIAEFNTRKTQLTFKPATTTSNIEAKKADIEKRRQEAHQEVEQFGIKGSGHATNADAHKHIDKMFDAELDALEDTTEKPIEITTRVNTSTEVIDSPDLDEPAIREKAEKSELTDDKQLVVKDKTTGVKLRDGRKTTVVNFAYLSFEYIEEEKDGNIVLKTKYDESGIPVVSESDIRLSSSKVSPGQTLEVKVDENHKDYKANKDNPDTVPIGIYIKGETTPIAYVHTPEWAEKNVAEGYINSVVEDTKAIRKTVLDNKSAEVTITSKSLGVLNRIQSKEDNNNGYINSLVSAFGTQDSKSPNIFGESTLTIAKSDIDLEGISDNLANQKNFVKGLTYMVIPTGTPGLKMATAVRTAKLNELNQTEVILRAVESFFNKEGLKLNGHNLNTLEGLFSFINEITFVGGKDPNAKRLNYNLVNNTFWLNAGTKDIPFNLNDSLEENLGKLNDNKQIISTVLDNKLFNVNKNRLNSTESYTLYKVEGNKIVEDSKYDNYSAFLGQKVISTNIHPQATPSGERTFFHQQVIGYGLTSAEVVKKQIKETKPEEITSEEQEKREDLKKFLEESGLTPYEDADDSGLDSFSTEESEELSPSFERTDLKFYRAKDLSLEQQNNIVNTITNSLVKEIEAGSNPKTAFENTLKKFKGAFNKALSNNEVDKAKIIKSIIENWSSTSDFIGFVSLAEIKLKQLSTSILDEGFNMEEGSLEKRNFSEDSTFKTNPKDTASARLKQFLSFIPVAGKKNIIGTDIYYDFNELYNELSSYLADTEFEDMIPELQELATIKPQYRLLLDKLNTADASIKNEFLSNFKKRYSEQHQLGFDISEDGVSAYTRSSNRNSLETTLQQSWLENLKNSNLLSTIESGENLGATKINTEKAKELLQKVKDLYSKNKETFTDENLEEFKTLLAEIGIIIDIKALKDLRANTYISREVLGMPVPNSNKDLRYKNIQSLISQKLIKPFEVLAAADENALLENNNPFDNEKDAIKILAKAQKKYEVQLQSSSYRDALGNSIFAYNNPTYLSNEVLALKNNEEKVKALLNTTFAKDSYLLKGLLDKNSEIYNIFNITRFDATRKSRSNEGAVEFSEMPKKLRELTKFWLFQNQGAKSSAFVDLTYSDKKITNLVHLPKVNTKDWRNPESEPFKILKSLLIAELERVKTVKKQIETLSAEEKISGYHTDAKAGTKVFLFPSANDLELVTDEVLNNIVLTELESLISLKKKTLEEQEITEKLFDKSYLTGKNGIRKKVENKEQVFDYAVEDFVINHAIATGSMIQAIHGDIALTGKKGAKLSGYISKTYTEYFKRLAKDIAPGVESQATSSKTKVIFAKDVKISNAYSKIFDKELESTDAQAFTTTKHHITKQYERGLITSTLYNSMLAKIEKYPNTYDAHFTEEEMKVILQPRKPVYVKGNIANGVNNIVYLKFSDYPLLPSLTKDSNMDSIRKSMESSNADMLIFKSGTKIGLSNPASLYNDNGDFNTELNLENHIVDLDSEGFRIQQDNPVKEENRIIEATQQRKLLFVDIADNHKFGEETKESLKKSFDQKHIELTNIKFNDLLNEFNVTKLPNGEYEIKDLSEFQAFLKSEAITRGWNPNELAMLELTPDKQSFKLNLMYSNQVEKLESLLTSLVNNNVLRNKLPGKSYIQASSVGYESASKNVFSDPALKYMQKDETGYYSEVAVAWPYKDLKYSDYVNEDGTPKANIDKELLYLIGYRIPNQGHNSMLRLKVTKFLNPQLGDLMLVPSEITLQMGSDFDVDKMNTYSYNSVVTKSGNLKKYKFNEEKLRASLSNKTEELVDRLLVSIFGIDYQAQKVESLVSKAKQKQLENEIIDINHKVLSSESIQDKIKKPLSSDGLKDAVDEISDLLEKTANVTSILSDEVSDKALADNKSGKLLTGTTSLSATNHALSQEAKLSIKENKDGKAILVTFKDDSGKVLKTKSLHKTTGFTGKTISEVIATLQSAAVDNAKEQLVGKANINKYTYAVTDFIARSGFDERFLVAFLNQEVIHELVNNLEKTEDITEESTKKLKPNQVKDSLLKKYEKLAGESIEEIKGFSIKEMRDLLKESFTDTKSKEYYKAQAQIIYNFIEYDKVGKELTALKAAISPESSGIGKSITEMLFNRDKVERVLGSFQYLENAEKFLQEDTYIGNALEKALFETTHIYKNLLPYSERSYQAFYNTIQREFGNDRLLTLENKEELNRELKSAIFSNILDITDLKTERENLLIDKFSIKDGEKVFKNKSLAQRLIEYKGNNKFFKKLKVELTTQSGNPSYINYLASAVEEEGEGFENSIAWQEALNSKNETEKQFAEDLIKYAYLTGGSQTKSGFVKYVPTDYIINKISAKNIDFTDSIVFENVYKQYFQHNPWRANKISNTFYEAILPKTAFENGKLKKNFIPNEFLVDRDSDKGSALVITYKDIGGRGNKTTLPDFLSVRINRQWHLYEMVGINEAGKSQYVKINTLGDYSFKEYDINSSSVTSILPKNNIVTPKVKTPGANLSSDTKQPETKPENNTYSTLAKAVKENDLSKALELIENGTGRFSALANFLKDKIAGLSSEIDTTLRAKGKHIEGKIFVNPSNNKTREELEDTILHEVIHGLSSSKIQYYLEGKFEFLTTKDKEALDSLNTLMTTTKNKVKNFDQKQEKLLEYINKYKGLDLAPSEMEEAKTLLSEVYGLTNLKEFVSMLMTNREFQSILNEIPFDNKKSILQRFIDLITKLIGLDVKPGSVLESSVNEVINLISTPNLISLSDADFLVDFNGKKITKLSYYLKNNSKISKEDIEDIIRTNKVGHFYKNMFLMNIGAVNSYDVRDKSKGEVYYKNQRKLNYIQQEFPGLLTLTPTEHTYKIEINDDYIEKHNSGQLNLFSSIEDFSPAFSNKKKKTTGDVALDTYLERWKNLKRKLKEQVTQDASKAAGIQLEIDTLEEQIDNLLTEKSLGAVTKTAYIQLKQASAAINSENLTAESLNKALTYIAAWEDIDQIFEVDPTSESAKVIADITMAASSLRKQWSKVAQDWYYKESIKQGLKYTKKEFFKDSYDTSLFKALAFDSSVSTVPLEISIDKTFKETLFKANDELLEKSKTIEKLYKPIKSKVKQLLQTYEGGRLTGNLVDKYKQEYYDKVAELRLEAAEEPSKWKNFWKFIEENAYKLTTKEVLEGKSDNFTEEEIKKAKELLDQYEEDKKNFIENEKEKLSYSPEYINKDTDDNVKLAYERNLADNITQWEHENSPFLFEKYNTEVKAGKRKSIDLKGMKGYKYTLFPKPKEQWRDKKYEIIQKDADLKAFYDFFKSTVEEYLKFLPNTAKVQTNTIPELKRALLETLVKGNFKSALLDTKNNLINSITTDELSDTEYGIIDEETGLPVRQLKAGMLSSKLTPEEKSYELDKVLMSYIAMASQIKYKAQVEDKLLIGQKLLNDIAELKEGVDGPKKNWLGNTIRTSNGLQNTKNRVNYMLDVFYGQRKKLEGVFKAGEKKVAASKVVDRLIGYTTAKGLALNPFSGMTNLFFGKVSNRIEAAGGRVFNDRDLNKAEAVVAAAVFNKESKEKLALLMEKLQVLGDLNPSNYGGHSAFDKLYFMQKIGEHVIQGDVTVAILIHDNLWDKIEVKEGQLIFPEGTNVQALSAKIKQMNKYLHGNYQLDSPTMIKSNVWGRMLMTFRSWIPYGVQNRFGKEMEDKTLGVVRKGRYISFATLGFGKSLSILFKLSLLGKLGGTEVSGLSDVDLANMKQNLRELSYMASFTALTFMLKSLAEGDDDDKEKYNYFANITLRIQDDIDYFINPSSFQQITRDPLPVFRSAIDLKNLISDTGGLLIGNDEIKSGKHKGDSRWFRSLRKAFPVWNQPLKFAALTEDTMDKPLR